jgi:uncharacterized protein
VVEIVDTEKKIMDFLPVLDSMMASGLVTLERVQVLQLRQGRTQGNCSAGLSAGDDNVFNS